MPDSPAAFPLPLPDRPDLRHLKDQAKDLVKSGAAATLAAAQLRIARQYGFPSWPRLKAHVESSRQVSRLKRAIDTNDLPVVKALMSASPALHRAPLGYGKNGPLTWVAECRIPWEPPTTTRLAMAQWMLDHGSDVHQGGDGPLMRAALAGYRVPMMELLVANGANVNAQWNGDFPIILAPCETVDPVSLQWLLEHGARPVFAGDPGRDTALDYVIATYLRTERLPACIDLLVAAGCPTRFGSAAVLAILRDRPDELAALLAADPSLAHRRFDELDFGSTAGRRLLLTGATLLHVAAEYGNVDAARVLFDHGADINAPAEADSAGIGGQTPVFHAASQGNDYGLSVAQFLVAHGADLSVRVTLPGHYERPDEFVHCTPLGYALRFPGAETATVKFLRDHGAPE